MMSSTSNTNLGSIDATMEQDENGDRLSPNPIVFPRMSSDEEGSNDSTEVHSFRSNFSSSIDDETDTEHDENVPPIEERCAPVEIPSKTRLKIRINKLHIAAKWRWKHAKDETCGICRMTFESCCDKCMFPGDSCPLVVGVCRHAFHAHCIAKWIDTQTASKPHCPLCRQDWKPASVAPPEQE